MLQQERHNQILAKLNLERQVTVKELSRIFQVTEDCIRKDLRALEKENKLKRTHGGAVLTRVNLHTLHVNDRRNIRIEEKKTIALKAVELIKPGTVIFLDISTVALEIAKLIYQRNMNITVVTNMIDIMEIFTRECSVQLIFLGGKLNHSGDGFVGSLTIDQIQKYRFDMAFLGAVGIDVEDKTVSTYDADDGMTKKAVIAASRRSYLTAEIIKYTLDGNFIYASLEDFSSYIGEKDLNDHIKQKVPIQII
ncbi:DeoR/GlpR family DNA-binding transcription regulator [Eggerthia catenaformis]|uniref:DeoR/GlpR family DNA-binding transcription regulator n=1 Tax=Eggerthia catenaformis TaxID=31973 RepID=UPI0028E488B4|nr:DeoR/GlpR family DNA-binding transcription regulator [Eggerthia catenaformis]